MNTDTSLWHNGTYNEKKVTVEKDKNLCEYVQPTTETQMRNENVELHIREFPIHIQILSLIC